MRVLWAARTLRHDVRLILAGMRAFRRHARSRDEVQVGLSVFSTPTHVVTRQAACTYDVAIANLKACELHETLRLDIWSAERPGVPDGLYASFEKRLILAPRVSSRLSIVYDWTTDARFVLDGQSLGPDAYVDGPCSTLGLYIIRATLLDAAGRPHEPLDVVQLLTS
jgi:hypothetical protein